MRHCQKLFLVLTFVIFSCSALAQTPTEFAFSAAQKTAIEKIVRNYLLNNPTILIEMSQALQRKETKTLKERAMKVLPSIAQSLFNAPSSPVGGDLKGAVTLVEFFDYQCPHCKNMTKIVNAILKTDPKLRVVYKELPIFGDTSIIAAKVALASAKQGKYQAVHDALMQAPGRFQSQKAILAIAKKAGVNMTKLKKAMKDKSFDKELKNNFKLAGKLNILGTPAFVVARTPKMGTTPTIKTLKPTFIPGATNRITLVKAIEEASAE